MAACTRAVLLLWFRIYVADQEPVILRGSLHGCISELRQRRLWQTAP